MMSFQLRFVLISLCVFLCCAAGCSGCDFDLDFWGDDDPDECSSDADCFGGTCQFLNDGNRCVGCTGDEDCGCGEFCNALEECEQDQFANPCPDCAETATSCDFDSDCCSGQCDEFGACVDAFPPGCIDLGESCSALQTCCGGVCADGVCAQQKCEPYGSEEIVASLQLSIGALGEDASTLYWVSNGELRSASKVGGEVTTLAIGAGAGGCLSRFGNRTSWCGDGGDIWQLVDGDDAPSLYAVATAAVGALIDSEAGLYWSEASGEIMMAAQPLPAPPQLLATAISSSPPIAVDASSLFFADGATLNAMPIGGGAVSPLFTGAGPIAVFAQDEESLYFVDSMTMTALEKIGGAPASLGFAESAREIAVSAADVFYADTFIARIPKTGGETTTLVNQVEPPSLLVDDQCVYWVDATEGRIKKISKN